MDAHGHNHHDKHQQTDMSQKQSFTQIKQSRNLQEKPHNNHSAIDITTYAPQLIFAISIHLAHIHDEWKRHNHQHQMRQKYNYHIAWEKQIQNLGLDHRPNAKHGGKYGKLYNGLSHLSFSHHKDAIKKHDNARQGNQSSQNQAESLLHDYPVLYILVSSIKKTFYGSAVTVSRNHPKYNLLPGIVCSQRDHIPTKTSCLDRAVLTWL